MTFGDSMRTALVRCLMVGLAPLVLAGCGGEDAPEPGSGGGESEAEAFEFPPDVAFDPDEWETAVPTKLGDPRATRDVKRPFVIRWGRFPPCLRTDGPNSNLVEQRDMKLLIYEPMVDIDHETEEFIPVLATHWKIETDEENQRQTFWYRLDERARFSDGSPVTARDIYYSWWHRVQEDRQAPSNVMTFKENYGEPEIVDRLTIKVTTTELNWRLFTYFGGMLVYKADEVHIPGDQYLEDYNWKWLTGSGPYVMSDLKKGESVTLKRRADWWGDGVESNADLYNFDSIKFQHIREQELYYEKFKNDEMDWYLVGRAQRWVEEIPKEEIVVKGWVKRRKIFNKKPAGYFGLAFNMRKPPFDDRRMRLAFAHLFNRERLMEKILFNQYEYINSYYPGRDWGNEKENPEIHFDPDRAAELMAEAGYSERGADGYLVGPDGKRLEMTLYYVAPSWERIWLVVKESYEDAGVKFNLERIDGATLVKKITDRQFTIHSQGVSALIFPNPETTWRSDLADKKNNNNIPGFKSAEVDALLERYNVVFDRAEQKKIVREIDRLVYEQHPYALGWYGPYTRILFWDRFGYPDRYVNRLDQYPRRGMWMTWWFDPAKDAALKKARESGATLPQGEVEVHPWKD